MGEKTKYLFLTGLFPKETEDEIFRDSFKSVQSAANVLQWNITDGFDKNLEEPIKILNSLYIGSWPKRYKKLFIPTYSFKHCENADDLNVGFCNLAGYRIFSKGRTLNREVKKWIKSTPEKKVIIAYAMTDVMINALYKAKKIDKDIKTCLIVPDLPQFMNTGVARSKAYNFLKAIDMKSQKTKIPHIDSFVFLTEQMNDKIKAKKYAVVEGIAGDKYSEADFDKKLKKAILYTGSLNSKYGIINLVDAFMKIDDPEYRLILCGSGDAVSYIKEAQKKDKRIDYRGMLPHKEVLELQTSATVLVNPRQNNEEYTKYSFPSKTMEYMLSGTPVVMYKLDGIPDEYDKYLSYVCDDSPESLKDALMRVCEMSEKEIKEIGQRSRKFVLENKNSAIQVKKILDMLSDN